MQNTLRQRYIFAISLVIVITGLACNLPFAANTDTFQDDPAAREEALKTFNEKWTSLARATPDEHFELAFSEQELTAVLIEQIHSLEMDSQTQFFFQNPQITLQNGSITITGQILIASIPVNGKAAVIPSITDSGKISVAVEKMEFGGMEFDQTTLSSFTGMIEQSINQPLYALPVSVSVESLAIENGILTISGALLQ